MSDEARNSVRWEEAKDKRSESSQASTLGGSSTSGSSGGSALHDEDRYHALALEEVVRSTLHELEQWKTKAVRTNEQLRGFQQQSKREVLGIERRINFLEDDNQDLRKSNMALRDENEKLEDKYAKLQTEASKHEANSSSVVDTERPGRNKSPLRTTIMRKRMRLNLDRLSASYGSGSHKPVKAGAATGMDRQLDGDDPQGESAATAPQSWHIDDIYGEDLSHSLPSPRDYSPVDDRHHEDEVDIFSETSSVFSHTSSLDSSTTTSSSLGPQASTIRQEAVDTFAQLLVQDEATKPLLAEGIETIGNERLEPKCRQLLRRFAADFRQEAENEAQKQLAMMVKRNTRSIAHIVLSDLGQSASRKPASLDQWLQSLDSSAKGFSDQTDDRRDDAGSDGGSDGGSDRGSDSDSDVDDTLQRIDQLRASVLASLAFSKFRTALEELIRPGPKMQREPTISKHEGESGAQSLMPQHHTIQGTTQEACRDDHTGNLGEDTSMSEESMCPLPLMSTAPHSESAMDNLCHPTPEPKVTAIRSDPILALGVGRESLPLGLRYLILEAALEFAAILCQGNGPNPLLVPGFNKSTLEESYSLLLTYFSLDLEEDAADDIDRHIARYAKGNAALVSYTVVSLVMSLCAHSTEQIPGTLHQQGENEGGVDAMQGHLPCPDTTDTWARTLDPQAVADALGLGAEGRMAGMDGDELGAIERIRRVRASVPTTDVCCKFRAKLYDLIFHEMHQQAMVGGPEPKRTGELGDNRVSNLEHLLSKACRPLGQLLPSHAISSLVGFLQDIVRPRIPEGHQRITWICGCGKAMYADVQEVERGAAARLEQELRRDAAAAATRPGTDTSIATEEGSQSSGEITAIPRRQNEAPSPGSADTSETGESSGSDAGTSLSSDPTVPDQEAEPTPTRNRFLLLCVNGPSYTRWKPILLPADLNDDKLFDTVRDEYKKLRQSYVRDYDQIPCPRIWTRLLPKLVLCGDVCWDLAQVFFTPKSANFVKFQVLPIRGVMVADVHKQPCLPPREEVQEGRYHYFPCPPDIDNPCLRVPYLHRLWSSGGPHAHTYKFWTSRTPKKLNEAPRYQDDTKVVFGWGVYIIEGPNYLALALLTAISLISSMILGLVYSVKTQDVSSGFTIASFFIAAEGMILTMGMTMLITALSYPN